MRRNKTAEWQPFETAPKDGTELIFWVSSQKGFQDTAANFYFAGRLCLPSFNPLASDQL